MTTSKIKTIKEVKPYTNSYGTTFYHLLEMDNGDKINIGKKKELKEGWELTYEITENGQQEYNQAKAVKPEATAYNGSSYKKSSGGQSNTASFSLSYAKDLAIAHINNGKDFTSTNILEVAHKFNEWLKENS